MANLARCSLPPSQMIQFLNENLKPLLKKGDASHFFHIINELTGRTLLLTHAVCMEFLSQDPSDIIIGYVGYYSPNILRERSFALNHCLLGEKQENYASDPHDLVAIAVKYVLKNPNNQGNREIVEGLVREFQAPCFKALTVNRLPLHYREFFISQLEQNGISKELALAEMQKENATYKAKFGLCIRAVVSEEVILGTTKEIFNVFFKNCLKSISYPGFRDLSLDMSADWFEDHLFSSEYLKKYHSYKKPFNFDINILQEFAQQLPICLLHDESRMRKAFASLKIILPETIFLHLSEQFPPNIQDLLFTDEADFEPA